VRVGDVVAELRAFAAEITLGCHGIAPILILRCLVRLHCMGLDRSCIRSRAETRTLADAVTMAL
jgi:hypothetical protein